MMDEVIRENERLIQEINKTREITVQSTGQEDDPSDINIYNRSRDVDLNTGFYHHVEFGESLSKIAKRYQVPIDSIIEANGLSNPDALYVGQKLFIPAPREE
jgi:LysM repeat protein